MIKLKKIINLLCITSACITCILIVCTALNEYGFLYVASIFHNSYRPVQIGVSTTLALLGIRFLIWEKGRRKIVYCLISFLLCFMIVYTMFFIR